MDNGSIIGLVGLITAVFTGIGLILARIKHSECLRGCCQLDTRSPTRMDSVISAPPPTPTHKRKRHNAESEDTEDKHEDKKSEFNLDIIDSSV